MASKHTNPFRPFFDRLKTNVSKNSRQYLLKGLYYLLIPFLCFYSLEYYTHNPWEMEFLPQLINYFLFLAAGFFFYELTGRSWCATAVLSLYALITGIANYFVVSFRGNPILPWDLQSIETALSISDNYTYELDFRFYISTTLLALTFFSGFFIRKRKKQPFFCRKRIIGCAGSAAVLLILAFSMMETRITNQVLTPTNLFTQWASYQDNGFSVSFLQNLQYLRISKPTGYHRDTLDQELQEFMKQYSVGDSGSPTSNRSDSLTSSSSDTLTSSSSDSLTPNNSDTLTSSSNTPSASFSSEKAPQIFVIMNESFSDLSVLHEFETNEDYMPYIHSLQTQDSDHLITGNLLVSVCGGNTANTEFEFLTGNTMAFLPPGSVAYQQYISSELPSLASQLADHGYSTEGLHPYNASGWNRSQVYPWLGFQESYFRNDFFGSRIIRKYVSDESAFSKLVSLYEAKDANETLFLFEVTMQNHGGYSQLYDDFPIQISLSDVHTSTSYATEHYLTLVQESDRAFQELITYLETVTEPVIVLMFGDHQPNDFVSENIASLTGVKKEDRSLEESQNRYIVPYVIWANYPLDKESAGFSDLSAISSSDPINANTLSCNYLGACLTRLAGQETSTYQDFLLLLRQQLPVITANTVIDAEGTYMTIKEAQKRYPEWMNLYEKLQYRLLFDRED